MEIWYYVSQRSKVDYVQIKDLQPGSYVYGYDEETGEIKPFKVRALLDMGMQSVFRLAVTVIEAKILYPVVVIFDVKLLASYATFNSAPTA